MTYTSFVEPKVCDQSASINKNQSKLQEIYYMTERKPFDLWSNAIQIFSLPSVQSVYIFL
jgi:hypothetical protein